MTEAMQVKFALVYTTALRRTNVVRLLLISKAGLLFYVKYSHAEGCGLVEKRLYTLRKKNPLEVAD
jgi:hypothetical protein